MNKVTLLGRLTKDVELNYSKDSIAYSKSSIAVNNRHNKTTLFIDVVFFNKLAEIANQYLKKGSKICIHGSLSLNEYTDKQGNNRQKHSVIAQDLEMLDTKGDESVTVSSNISDDFKTPKKVYIPEDEIPF